MIQTGEAFQHAHRLRQNLPHFPVLIRFIRVYPW
jgi:hypothetical protein